MKMCISSNNPYPPQGRSSDIPGGGGGVGILKVNILEAKYGAKWGSMGGVGEGARTKNLLWGEYGYFLKVQNYSHGNFRALPIL